MKFLPVLVLLIAGALAAPVDVAQEKDTEAPVVEPVKETDAPKEHVDTGDLTIPPVDPAAGPPAQTPEPAATEAPEESGEKEETPKPAVSETSEGSEEKEQTPETTDATVAPGESKEETSVEETTDAPVTEDPVKKPGTETETETETETDTQNPDTESEGSEEESAEEETTSATSSEAPAVEPTETETTVKPEEGGEEPGASTEDSTEDSGEASEETTEGPKEPATTESEKPEEKEEEKEPAATEPEKPVVATLEKTGATATVNGVTIRFALTAMWKVRDEARRGYVLKVTNGSEKEVCGVTFSNDKKTTDIWNLSANEDGSFTTKDLKLAVGSTANQFGYVSFGRSTPTILAVTYC